MEWARAKSIIIILFIVLNVFLLSRIIMEYGDEGTSKEAILNMEKILKNRGVVVECKIPLYDSDTPRLVFGNGEFNIAVQVEELLGLKPGSNEKFEGEEKVFQNGHRKLIYSGPNRFTYLNEMPEDTVDINDMNEAEKYLKKFLKERKLDNSTYVQDGMPERQGDGIVFTYLEKYKGFLVYDNYLKAVVTEKGVTRLEVSHREIIRLSPEKISDISTAHHVLLENFDGSDKVVITAIDLGYRDVGPQDHNNLQLIEQLPVWRIKVKESDREVRWFGASDGKEIK